MPISELLDFDQKEHVGDDWINFQPKRRKIQELIARLPGLYDAIFLRDPDPRHLGNFERDLRALVNEYNEHVHPDERTP